MLDQWNCIKTEVPVQWFSSPHTTDEIESLHGKLEPVQARNSSSNTIVSVQESPSTKQNWVSTQVQNKNYLATLKQPKKYRTYGKFNISSTTCYIVEQKNRMETRQ